MSDQKEIDIKFSIGDMTNPTPGHSGTISLVTGATEANKVWSELQGRYGEDFDNKPVIIISSEDAEGLKNILENIENTINIEEGEEEEFKMMKENMIQPDIRRVGNDIVITRKVGADEITPFLAGFQDVLNGNVSMDIDIKANKTPETLCKEKKNLLYMAHNGAKGSINMKMDLPFLERCFDMGTQFAPVPEPETAKSMLNFFKKFTLNIETFDADSLPDELKSIFDHPMIDQTLNFYTEEVLNRFRESMLPIMENAKVCSAITGPIKAYFPIKDSLAFKIEANAPGWFVAAYELLSKK